MVRAVVLSLKLLEYAVQAAGGDAMRTILTLCCAIAVAGCSVMRAEQASNAQAIMVGLTKEQVLACMRPPGSKAVEGATEVWSYNSGNGYVAGSTYSTANVYAQNGYGTGFGVARRRFCTVNVVMTGGHVSQVNYAGPTGGLLTQGEQCAYAVANCTAPELRGAAR
jgi:hypothetical protein